MFGAGCPGMLGFIIVFIYNTDIHISILWLEAEGQEQVMIAMCPEFSL